MTTQPKYDFRSLAITNIGWDEARLVTFGYLSVLLSTLNKRWIV